MLYDGIEKKILERMCEVLVATKSELIEFVQNETKVSKHVIDSVTRSLVQKGLLTSVYASQSTFAITQKGMRESSE